DIGETFQKIGPESGFGNVVDFYHKSFNIGNIYFPNDNPGTVYAGLHSDFISRNGGITQWHSLKEKPVFV
ncbi:MAG: hypothetical protein ACT6FE_08590, partial [Methanosarcinaceae archaeon]